MVRHKSRYLMFRLHYPILPASENVLPTRERGMTVAQRVKIGAQMGKRVSSAGTAGVGGGTVYHSDGNFLPGGREANLDEPSRIMLFHRPSPAAVTLIAVQAAVRDCVNRSFGDLGAGLVRATLAMKYFSPATSTGIIRVARDHFRIVWAALTLLTEIEGVRVVATVEHVSGTMRKCEKVVIQKNREITRAAQVIDSRLTVPS
ncbi:ribonuclease P/MRP protein subunit [Limtongia smithiae]|uniref:ribonuclease P/MRP protein subunit n=1 Tax=Limtongia smithiae TaxID=1125753 RepID=UPI0034CF83A2